MNNMPTTDRKLRVFLCHSSQDKPIVRELYQRLNAEGWIDPWLDEEKLLPGQDWDMEIEKAVASTEAVIVCISNNSINKEGYVQRELKFVLDIALEKPEGTIFIIPVRFDNCVVPRRIRTWQYVDYFPEDRIDRAYNQLILSLKSQAQNTTSTKSNSVKNGQLGTSNHQLELQEINAQNWGGINYVMIGAGKFLMGLDKSPDRRLSAHSVEIPYDYWITRVPITNLQFLNFLQSVNASIFEIRNRSYRKERSVYDGHPSTLFIPLEENEPVLNISLRDARTFIAWLNKHFAEYLPIPFVFRLPTEAEWEKATRGLKSNAPLGSPSLYGATMIGKDNTWEWTQSLAKGYPYKPEDDRVDLYPFWPRILRGGYNESSQPNVGYVRCTSRISTFSHYIKYGSYNRVGFHVVVAPPINFIYE
jgi:formylglycine-generating enzyme required for sulfatase activity